MYKIINAKKASWIKIEMSCFYGNDTFQNKIGILADIFDLIKNHNLIFNVQKYKDYNFFPIYKVTHKQPFYEDTALYKKIELEEIENKIFDFFEDIENKFPDIKKQINQFKKNHLDHVKPIQNQISLFLKSFEIFSYMKNKQILIEKEENLQFVQNSYVCFENGFLDKDGQSVNLSEARMFSSPENAQKRFPKANIFPVEVKINGSMLLHKNGIINSKAQEINANYQKKIIMEDLGDTQENSVKVVYKKI